jgi:hypothetical protein
MRTTLSLTPANNYDPQVLIVGGGNPATVTTELIDLSAPTPTWNWGPNMSQPRIELSATILPNDKILATGGSLHDEDTSTASLKLICRMPPQTLSRQLVRISYGMTTAARLDSLVGRRQSPARHMTSRTWRSINPHTCLRRIRAEVSFRQHHRSLTTL